MGARLRQTLCVNLSADRGQGACPIQTRHCLRTASWTTLGRGPPGSWCKEWLAGCRRRSRSSRSRWRCKPVAKELRQQLHIRGFAAARASAGELKQRIEQLNILDLRSARAGCDPLPEWRSKKFQFSRSASRNGACIPCSCALCLASLLLFTGQISTHSLQPVQSSGSDLQLVEILFHVFHFGFAVLKVAGRAGSQ